MKSDACLIVLLWALLSTWSNAQTIKIDFNDQERDKPPRDFTTALTGKGKLGNWTIDFDEHDRSRGNFLAQADMDRTDYRFPLCVLDSFVAKDVDVTVTFRPVNGESDQAGGIVWRYQDKDNYYVLGASALENKVVPYKVEHGKRQFV